MDGLESGWLSDEDRAFIGACSIPNPMRKWWQFWKPKFVIEDKWRPDQIARIKARGAKPLEINRLPPISTKL